MTLSWISQMQQLIKARVEKFGGIFKWENFGYAVDVIILPSKVWRLQSYGKVSEHGGGWIEKGSWVEVLHRLR